MSDEREIPGASYSQIRRVLDNSTAKPPTLEFVEQVADALGVRRAWLAFGDGAMTEEDEASRQTAARVAERFDERLRAVRDGIMDGLGVPTPEEVENEAFKEQAARWRVEGMDPERREATYREMAKRAALHREEGVRLAVLPALEIVDVCEGGARGLGEMVLADFRAINRDPLELEPQELDDYLLLRFGALLACLSSPRSPLLW